MNFTCFPQQSTLVPSRTRPFLTSPQPTFTAGLQSAAQLPWQLLASCTFYCFFCGTGLRGGGHIPVKLGYQSCALKQEKYILCSSKSSILFGKNNRKNKLLYYLFTARAFCFPSYRDKLTLLVKVDSMGHFDFLSMFEE